TYVFCEQYMLYLITLSPMDIKVLAKSRRPAKFGRNRSLPSPDEPTVWAIEHTMRLPTKNNKMLDLAPPSQDRPGRSGPDFRRQAVARWLNSLPVTNLDETAKALLSALAEANTLRVRPAARRHFLETVRRSVHGVITSIEQQSWSRTYPQPE